MRDSALAGAPSREDLTPTGARGHLFHGRFIGHLVEEETYFLTVARTIVLNPVDAKMVASASEWPWSSYNATAGVARPPEWPETRRVLAKFHPEDRAAACRGYRQFIAAGAGGLPVRSSGQS